MWARRGGGGVPLHLGIRQNDVSNQLSFLTKGGQDTGVKDEDGVSGFGGGAVAAAKEED